jgi:hypothetical protein
VNKQSSQKDDLGPDRKGSCQTLLYTLVLTMGSEVNVSTEGEDPLQAPLDEAEHSMSKLVTSASRDNLVMDGFSIDSKEDEGDELEGTGQGSRAIFVIWLILSFSLLAVFSHFTPGMKLYSPFEQLLILSVLAIFYVDNGMPDIKMMPRMTPVESPSCCCSRPKHARTRRKDYSSRRTELLSLASAMPTSSSGISLPPRNIVSWRLRRFPDALWSTESFADP